MKSFLDQILFFIQNPEWQSLLDIGIIATGIYILYRTFRASGSMKVVTGTLIASAVFLAANYLDLRGITWIYSNLSSVILIALIVIFQPELRKIFERTASLYRKGEISGRDVADILPDVLFNLASRRWGALIVLPGTDSIESYISGGIKSGSQVSYALIESIFDPHSAGHDGAIIISNGRIESFGVRLPISETGQLSEEFGTRHHAAMGICELTDSLVLLVSEERGQVSFFKQGNMIPISNKENLKRIITKHFEGMVGYRDILKRRSKSSRKVAFLEVLSALTLALLIRIFMVQPEPEPQIGFFDIPIQAQLVGRVPDGMELESVTVEPHTVRIYQRLPAKKIVIRTAPIYLNTIREDTQLDVSLVYPSHAEPAGGRWPEVHVLIKVRSEEPKKEEDSFFTIGSPGS
ncbi:MAG: diadenylate cyclase [Spirochaetia bacterium]|nr:diadenylate cyclase [Spirochaetia bacterium]